MFILGYYSSTKLLLQRFNHGPAWKLHLIITTDTLTSSYRIQMRPYYTMRVLRVDHSPYNTMRVLLVDHSPESIYVIANGF